jgi:hypothetical protein
MTALFPQQVIVVVDWFGLDKSARANQHDYFINLFGRFLLLRMKESFG